MYLHNSVDNRVLNLERVENQIWQKDYINRVMVIDKVN